MTLTGFAPPTENRTLTPREIEIVSLVASDFTNPQICRRLYITRSTIKNHIRRIRFKLGIDSRVGLALWYFDNYGYHPLRK
jgi:DNA-binding CsgD family transcriptional regulator